MDLPADIASRRGSEFLDLMAVFAEGMARYHGAAEQAAIAAGLRLEPLPGVVFTAETFMAFHNAMRALKIAQEDHINRMERYRADGKRVFSETDPTVDAVIAAARSAFIRPAKATAAGVETDDAQQDGPKSARAPR
jgi:hypothetical protein